MHRSLRRRLLLAAFVAALTPFFANLGGATIWDANEAYYVETPREMIESGDYINPSFNYEPRFNKPVLSYWVVAGLYRVFGVSITVERAAIAALAMIMVIAAWALGRAASTQPFAAPLAALGLAVGPRFFMFSRRIFVDMAVTTMMTLTLLFFALSERYPARRRLFLMLMYTSVGLGVLTKGPVAAVIPLLVFVTYLAVHREIGRLRAMMIPAGILIALLIVAPWYVALYMEHGWTYITEFFIGENVGRFTETVGVQQRSPFFYLPVLLSDMLPWSLCLPALVAAWRRDSRTHGDPSTLRIRTLLLLWIGITVVFFSLSQTKQDLYIFPIVTAVAALGGDWVSRSVRPEPNQNADRWFLGTMTGVGIVMVVLGGAVLYLFSGDSPVYPIRGAQASALIAIAGGVVVAMLPWLRRHVVAVATLLVVLIAFNWILVLWALPSFEQFKPVVPLSRVIEQKAGPADVIAHSELALPSMVYYLRRHIEDDLYPDQLMELLRSDRRVFAVLPADRYDALKAQIAAAVLQHGTEYAVETCVVGRQKTADIKLRSLLERWAPPEVLVITNRCPVS